MTRTKIFLLVALGVIAVSYAIEVLLPNMFVARGWFYVFGFLFVLFLLSVVFAQGKSGRPAWYRKIAAGLLLAYAIFLVGIIIAAKAFPCGGKRETKAVVREKESVPPSRRGEYIYHLQIENEILPVTFKSSDFGLSSNIQQGDTVFLLEHIGIFNIRVLDRIMITRGSRGMGKGTGT